MLEDRGVADLDVAGEHEHLGDDLAVLRSTRAPLPLSLGDRVG
jgi:hypothetical protein